MTNIKKINTLCEYSIKQYLKSRGLKLILIVSISLIAFKVNAQVTFSNSDNIVVIPDWDHLKETFYYPYDSTELVIKPYPILEPYKKYIGQQIILVNDNVDLYNRSEYVGAEDKTYYNFNRAALKKGAYLTIIGVESLGDPKYSVKKEYETRRRYEFERLDGKYGGGKIPYNEYPVFLVGNPNNKAEYGFIADLLASNDPLDKNKNLSYLLVGGYIKLKEELLNKEVVYYTTSDFSLGYYQSSIQSTWKCIDVTIATGRYYCDDEYLRSGNSSNFLALQIQNIDNPQLIRNLKIGCLKFGEELKLSDKIFNSKMKSESSNGYAFKDVFENEMRARKSDYLKKQKKSDQEFAKRKQQLTAKYGATNANKIIAGKYEIGMSKDVCKEIAGYKSVIDKTATTETWKISNFWTGNATYLYFNDNKLIRVVNL